VKRTGHVFEQVAEFNALRAAARRAARGTWRRPGAAAFLADLERNVLAIQRELLDGTYRPGALTRFQITDPKPRTISAAPFRDRVVHHALCAALEPTFERYAVHHSYACRKGRGNRAAMLHAQRLAGRHPWYGKLDVRSFFESLEHAVLMRLLRRRFKDRRALALVETILEAGAAAPGRGIPIGNLTSQHFGNFALGHVDHFALERLRVGGWVRYMDDMLVFGPDKSVVCGWLGALTAFLHAELRLSVRDEITVLAPVHVGIPFLGFRIWPRQVRMDGARVRRFRRKVRALARARRDWVDEAALAQSAQSLFAWAAQADTWALRRSLLDRLEADGYGSA